MIKKEEATTKVEKIIASKDPEWQKRLIINQNINAILINLIDSNIMETETLLKETNKLTFANKNTIKNIRDRTAKFICQTDKAFNDPEKSEGFGEITEDIHEIFRCLIVMPDEQITKFRNQLENENKKQMEND